MEVPMDTTSWVIVGVIAGLLIIALLAVSRRSRQLPRANLMPLTPEARDRYVVRWDQVESRFVEAPAEAVREAGREGARGGTESLRMAMLHYRAVIEEMARIPEAERMREGRRETA